MSAQDPVKIVIVVAAARNRVIGRGNELPWRVPSDLKHFRALTLGRPIIMGRKTFASIGRVLDGRTNIVVTRDPAFRHEGVTVAASLAAALDLGRAVARRDGVGAVAVVGGGEIYAQALALADRVEMTEIDLLPEGDVHFPDMDAADWLEVARVTPERGPKDEADSVYRTFERRGR